MINKKLVEDLLAKPALPAQGFVAYFNIADLKHRNLLLGVHTGDQDIVEMTQLIEESAKAHNGLGGRVGGDEWLLFLPKDTEFQKIADKFHKKDSAQIG